MQQNNINSTSRVWCAVPVYNNKGTVRDIVTECRSILENVVVVDDGSTDADLFALLSGIDVKIIRHEKNLGKGRAILTASRYIEEQGGAFMITIDADGQHIPADINKFIPLLDDSAPGIIIGSRNFDTENVPGKSVFGRKFANFWLHVETGVHIDDCQSGFRAYPVKLLNRMKFRGAHYDFEAEALARAVWAGLSLKTVNVDVVYPEPDKRVSSFRPFLDNLRLTHTHAMLIGSRLTPFRHKQLVERPKTDFKMLRHPGKFLMMLLKENATPAGLAFSAAVGVFLAVLPLMFLHTFLILYVAARLNLNKIVAVNVQHLCMPPFVPALCIEIGFFIRNGQWLTNISYETVFTQFGDRLLEWLLGSLIIAPLGAVLIAVITFFSAEFIKRQVAADG
jgi:glycosyltransferase involved in cell wall biosynthesis